MWQKALLILLVISSFSFAQKKELEIIEINGVEAVKGELLIKFKKPNEKIRANQITAARQNLMTQHNAKVERKFRIEVEHWVLSDVNLEELIKELNDNEYVEYAEPNYIIRADAIIPNDPMFHEQWGLHNTGQTGGIKDADIDAPEAWEITTGDTSIVVGVIDSGIDYLHEDLRDNIWVNKGEIPNNGIDDDGNGYIDDYYGWDFVNNDNDPMDDNGHGTHVAGIIGARGDNGIGVAGVAWNCKLMALKFLGANGSGPTSAAIEAILYSVDNGALVTNNSWGGSGYNQALEEAIAYSENRNSLFIAAAGNDNSDVPHYPAFFNYSFSVSSTDHSDKKSSFSSFGFWVDISAPGTGILSTLPNDKYGRLSGTSMAAPMVTGLAVLVLSENMSWTTDQIRSQISLKSENIYGSNPNYIGELGEGRINLHQSVLPPEAKLQVYEYVVDDDQFGESEGNKDGLINAGETIELNIYIKNIGAISANEMSADLQSLNQEVEILQSSSTVDQIEAIDGIGQNVSPFLIKIDPNASLGLKNLKLILTDEDDLLHELYFSIRVYTVGLIRGKVYDLETQVGIPNAKLQYYGLQSNSLLTDNFGNFVIRDLLDGTYSIFADHDNYLASDLMQFLIPTENQYFEIGLGKSSIKVEPERFDLELNWNSQIEYGIKVFNEGNDTLLFDVYELPTGTHNFSSLKNYYANLEGDPNNGISIGKENREKVLNYWEKFISQNHLDEVPVIKVAYLRSDYLIVNHTLKELSINWFDYGPIPIVFDYVTLNRTNITYENIKSTNADVLVISNAAQNNDPEEYTEAERNAILQYLQDGAGIIVSGGTLFNRNAPNHTPFFAKLLGFDPDLTYSVPCGLPRPSYKTITPNSLARNIESPYLPDNPWFCSPESNDWRDAVTKAKIISASDNFNAIISTKDRNVFLSSIYFTTPNKNDIQMLYNAILYSASRAEWFDLQKFKGRLSSSDQMEINFIIDTKHTLPGESYSKDLLFLSNDVIKPITTLSVNSDINSSSAINIHQVIVDDDNNGESIGNNDGMPASGERIELNVVMANVGNLSQNNIHVLAKSSSERINLIKDEFQLDFIDSGESREVISAIVFDIESIDYDGEKASIEWEILAGNNTLIDSTVFELRKLNLIYGTVSSARNNLPLNNVRVVAVSTNKDSLISLTDNNGDFSIYAPEGNYSVYAESPNYLRSDPEIVTLPTTNSSINFELYAPEVEGLPTQLFVESENNHMIRTLSMTNTGDSALRYYFSSVKTISEPLGMNAQKMLEKESSTKAHLTQNNITNNRKDVLLCIDINPFGIYNTMIQDILDNHQFEYDIINSSKMGTINLSNYDKVIIPSQQPESFWNNLFNNKEWFENYVVLGGILELHTANSNNQYIANKTFPGGIVVSSFMSDSTFLFSNFHPIVYHPQRVTESDLLNAGIATPGYFSSYPSNTYQITGSMINENSRPTTIEVNLGEGVIIATQHFVEYYDAYPELLENMILFGLNRAKWIGTDGLYGKLLPGQTKDIELLFSDESLLPNQSNLDSLLFYSNLPGENRISIPTSFRMANRPYLDIVSFSVSDEIGGDGDGIPESGEDIRIDLKLKNLGNLPVSNLTVSLKSQLNTINVINSTNQINELKPGQESEVLAYSLELDESIPDETVTDFQIDCVDNNNYSQSLLVKGFVIMSDEVPPSRVDDLSIIATTRNSVQFSFTTTGDDGFEGRADIYDLRYSKSEINEANFNSAIKVQLLDIPKYSGEKDSIEVLGLEQDEDYYFALKLVDDAGNKSDLSNIVSMTTESRIEFSEVNFYEHLPPYSNNDGTINPGEKISVSFTVNNVSNKDFTDLTIFPDTTYDQYFFSNSAYYSDISIRIGQLNAGQSKSGSFPLYINAETPDQYELKIPITYYDNDEIVDNDTLKIPITGKDEVPPIIQFRSLEPKYAPIGKEVHLSARVFEPGSLIKVDALIVDNNDNIIAEIPMYDDGSGVDFQANDAAFNCTWTVDRIEEFHFGVRAVDKRGNETLSEKLRGFTSIPFVKSNHVLLVYDDVYGFKNDDYTNYILPTFERLGIKYDYWNIYFRDFVGAEVITQYKNGVVFWFAPNGGFIQSHSQQQEAIEKYLENEGAILVSGQNISYYMANYNPNFLTNYFGVTHSRENIDSYSLKGSEEDIISRELSFKLNGNGSANNQFNHTSLNTAGNAIPFLFYESSTSSLRSQKNNRINLEKSLPGSPINSTSDNTIDENVTNVSNNFSNDTSLVGGARFETNKHRAVFLSFGFEAINSDNVKDSLISRSYNWLSNRKNDNIPPANIDDLRENYTSHDFVEIIWTAPGNDGKEGKADRYDIRYNTFPPAQNMNDWWENASQVNDEPKPLFAGSEQIYRLDVVDERTNYFFMLRAQDEFSNKSGISNLAILSTTDPPIIQVDTNNIDLQIEKGDSLSLLVSIKNMGVGALTLNLNLDEIPPGLYQKIIGKLEQPSNNRIAISPKVKISKHPLNLLGDLSNSLFNSESWYLLSLNQTTLGAKDSVNVSISFNSNEIDVGTYEIYLIIGSNDPINPLLLKNFNISIFPVTSVNDKDVPDKCSLLQNYPNPFNPSTTIKYQIPTDGHVEIKIFNILGQQVKTLVNQPHQAGFYDVIWNGTNDNNVSIGSGVYIFRMISGEFVKSKKMIILK